MRLRKYLQPGKVYLITSRMEEGLLIPCTKGWNNILEAIMGRAQELYPVTICGFVFMANHFHLLVVVQDPENLVKFVGYLKQEIAHQINLLHGRRKKTIWCDGYDSPLLLRYEDIIEYLAYIHTNPQSAHLVERIEQYPGCSSWKYTSSTSTEISRERVRRCSRINESSEVNLTVSPFAWLKCINDAPTEETARADLVKAVRQRELTLTKERRESGKSVIGSRRLQTQKVNLKYYPKKFGKRMLVICRDIELRKTCIKAYKYLCSLCRQVYLKWKSGDLSASFPIGMFAPGRPKTVSPYPSIEFANAI